MAGFNLRGNLTQQLWDGQVKVEFGSLSLENKPLNNFNNFGQVSDAFPMLKYSTMGTHSEKYIIT